MLSFLMNVIITKTTWGRVVIAYPKVTRHRRRSNQAYAERTGETELRLLNDAAGRSRARLATRLKIGFAEQRTGPEIT
jgi:hypothetical protein